MFNIGLVLTVRDPRSMDFARWWELALMEIVPRPFELDAFLIVERSFHGRSLSIASVLRGVCSPDRSVFVFNVGVELICFVVRNLIVFGS